MASHAMYEYLIGKLIEAADALDALGIDGSHQPRDAAEALRVGKLSPNRAMSLLCRVEADVCMARTGNAWGDR